VLELIHGRRHGSSGVIGTNQLQRRYDPEQLDKAANGSNQFDRKDQQRVYQITEQIPTSIKPKIPK